MKLKQNDTILIISGKDKGKTAKVIKSFPKEKKILAEGMNLKSRHIKPKKQGEKGQIVKIPSPFDVSNVKLICPKCGKAVRLGYKLAGDKKYRTCKKCKSEI